MCVFQSAEIAIDKEQHFWDSFPWADKPFCSPDLAVSCGEDDTPLSVFPIPGLGFEPAVTARSVPVLLRRVGCRPPLRNVMRVCPGSCSLAFLLRGSMLALQKKAHWSDFMTLKQGAIHIGKRWFLKLFCVEQLSCGNKCHKLSVKPDACYDSDKDHAYSVYLAEQDL